MIQCIIFDYNRTLYIPELTTIPRSSIQVLKELQENGIDLVLLSNNSSNEKNDLSPISSFFSKILFGKIKTPLVFKDILYSLNVSAEEVLVVGDRIQSEIKSAAEIGIKTLWYRQGKFRDEFPPRNANYPWKIISSLQQIMTIITRMNRK